MTGQRRGLAKKCQRRSDLVTVAFQQPPREDHNHTARKAPSQTAGSGPRASGGRRLWPARRRKGSNRRGGRSPRRSRHQRTGRPPGGRAGPKLGRTERWRSSARRLAGSTVGRAGSGLGRLARAAVDERALGRMRPRDQDHRAASARIGLGSERSVGDCAEVGMAVLVFTVGRCGPAPGQVWWSLGRFTGFVAYDAGLHALAGSGSSRCEQRTRPMTRHPGRTSCPTPRCRRCASSWNGPGQWRTSPPTLRRGDSVRRRVAIRTAGGRDYSVDRPAAALLDDGRGASSPTETARWSALRNQPDLRRLPRTTTG